MNLLNLLTTILLLLTACTTTTVVTQPTAQTPDIVEEAPQILPVKPVVLKWGADKQSWSDIVLQEVAASEIASHFLTDASQWCPNYDKISVEERVVVFAHLMSALAEKESSFNPKSTYKENFRDSKGSYVISTGLFQLSLESAQQKRYECVQVKTQEDLMSPVVNAACAVKIATYLAKKSSVISNSEKQGMAAYWSVMRPTHPKNQSVKAYVQNLELCRSK